MLFALLVWGMDLGLMDGRARYEGRCSILRGGGICRRWRG